MPGWRVLLPIPAASKNTTGTRVVKNLCSYTECTVSQTYTSCHEPSTHIIGWCVFIYSHYDLKHHVVLVQTTYLSCLLLEGHEVQIGDVDHVRAAHHCQHPVLHLPCQGADIQQLPQLGFLSDEAQTRQKTKSVKSVSKILVKVFGASSVPVMSRQLLIYPSLRLALQLTLHQQAMTQNRSRGNGRCYDSFFCLFVCWFLWVWCCSPTKSAFWKQWTETQAAGILFAPVLTADLCD